MLKGADDSYSAVVTVYHRKVKLKYYNGKGILNLPIKLEIKKCCKYGHTAALLYCGVWTTGHLPLGQGCLVGSLDILTVGSV